MSWTEPAVLRRPGMGELRRFRDPTRVAAQNPIWSKALRPAWSRFDCVSRPTCRHGGALAGHLLNAQAHRRGEERLDRATLSASAVGISLRGRAERQRRQFCARARDRHAVPALRSRCSARSQNTSAGQGAALVSPVLTSLIEAAWYALLRHIDLWQSPDANFDREIACRPPPTWRRAASLSSASRSRAGAPAPRRSAVSAVQPASR
jgi:hypothetical protein